MGSARTGKKDQSHIVDGLLRHEPLSPSSVFDSRVPAKRFQRQLSHSKVGLSGNSPFHPHIRDVSPSRENRARKQAETATQGEDIKVLWKLYIDLEGHTLSNHEMKKIGQRLTTLLVKDLKSATKGGDDEALKRAVATADGKLQIINMGGMLELKAAKKAVGLNPDTLPDPCAIGGTAVKDKAPKLVLQQKQKDAISNKGPSSPTATSDTALEDGETEEEAEEEYEEGQEDDAAEGDEAAEEGDGAEDQAAEEEAAEEEEEY